ncbi:MAG: PAS domain-containing sensor histidine kinase [Prolixibacteraceae bacterium]|nr:PAS domain-containing sensor histidine kinase [Prolixibacteraceae bacterium]
MKQEDNIQNGIESLFSSEELYQILFENATDAIFFIAKSKVIDCNKNACSLLGIHFKEEICGKHPFDYSPEFQPDSFYSKQKALEILGAASPGETFKFNYEFRASNGSLVDTEITMNCFGRNDQTFVQLTIHNITSLRTREKALSQTEDKYKKIFENVQDVFYQTDLNGNITAISPSIERYSKYIHSDIIGKPIDNFYFNPDDRKELIKEIAEKGEAHDFEVLLKGRNNQLVWGSVNAHFTFDEFGQTNGIEGTIRDLSERKDAEEKLKHSLSLLQATLDSTADGILVVSREGRITSFNKQFKKMFKLTSEIIESGEDTAAIEFVLNQLADPDQFVSKVNYLYDHPKLESFDTIELKDGRVLERFSCPQYLDDKPIGRVWNFSDITTRKKAEQQLNLMAHALKSINESINITDTNNRILFLNAAFLKTYGYEDENELIGKDITILRSPNNDPEVVDKILPTTSDTGWQGEILNKRKDGTEFPISLSTSVVLDENGKTLGMVGVAVDITERKQTLELLRQSEMKYRNLIETMPDGYYRSTSNGKFVEVNKAMVKLLGYESEEELMSIDIKKDLYFEPSDRESLTLETNPEELDVYQLKKKDGTAVWIEDHGWYVKDKSGRIIFHEGVSRDITERKIAEIQLQKYSEELQEANATKDKFFSIIAHDLKSPFNSVMGFSEIIKNEARNLDIATIEQYAGLISATSTNTYRLLENLLDWARMQQAQILFKPISFILVNIVNEVLEIMIEKANSKMIAIINYIPSNLIVWADEDMLKTILRNLISNALKFTSTNGKVEIKAIIRNDEMEISVVDNGIGIKPDEISKIFKIGSSFSKRGTENEKGTGLGLLLCKEFVEIHGGKIWVESEEGKGSTFVFTLKQNR